MGDIDFSGSNEDSIRAGCIAATADYAAAILAAGHQLCTDWARSVRERVPVPAEPVPPFAAATEAPPTPGGPVTTTPRGAPPPESAAAPRRRATATACVRAITAAAKLTLADIRSDKRTQQVTRPRQEVMYVLRTEYHWSYPRIGRYLDKDHSTVHHGARRHAERKGLPAPR